MYKNLFVPVDGSELSHRAMDGSIELAQQLGATITGFVVEPDLPLSVMSNDAQTSAERIQRHASKNEAHAKSLLDQFEQRAQAAGVAFSASHVTAYSVDHAIMDEAEKAGCDMIVMVTHGRGVFGEMLYGSHTKNVMSKTKVPLLVLH